MSKFSTGLLLVSSAIFLSSSVLAANPCKPIAAACKKDGYYQGGADKGKGLIKDCMMPVVAGEKTMPNTDFSDSMKQECKAKMEKEMKNKM